MRAVVDVREQLLASGALKPEGTTPPRRPSAALGWPVLALDAAGRAAAQRHLEAGQWGRLEMPR